MPIQKITPQELCNLLKIPHKLLVTPLGQLSFADLLRMGAVSFDNDNCVMLLNTCTDATVTNPTINVPEECYVETIYIKDPDNPKGILPVSVFKNTDTGTPIYYFQSDTNFSNPININDYEMANVPGIPNQQTPQNSTGTIPFHLCGGAAGFSGTLADLLPVLAADTDWALTGGGTPDGLLAVEIYAEYKGQTCNGEVLTAQGATVGTRTLDGGESWSKKLPYVDADCDNFAGFCIDLTTPLVIPAGAGIIGEAVGVECDADDTTA